MARLRSAPKYTPDYPAAENSNNDERMAAAGQRDLMTSAEIRGVILGAALLAATSGEERRRVGRLAPAVAVTVRVPTTQWISPVEDFIKKRRSRWLVIARAGDRKFDHKPTSGNEMVADALARGRSVVGIATSPEQFLPATLTATAELRVTLKPLSADVVRKVLARCYPNEAVPAISDDVVAGLDLDDVVAALREDAGLHDVIGHLARASRSLMRSDSTADAPDLEQAIEYGAAQVIALRYACDIRDYVSGKIPFSAAMKGIMLHGLPGTGKTVLAAAIAKAAGVPLLRYSISDWFQGDSHLGTVVQRQREMYATATRLAPCLLLQDEFDGLPNRAHLSDRAREWWTVILEQGLLLCDSGIAGGASDAGRSDGVFLVGCTNHLQNVDPAFLRVNRFERAVEIGLPDAAGLANVMRQHLGDELAVESLIDVGRRIEGSTAAEAMAVVQEARRRARHSERDLILQDLIDAAGGDQEIHPLLDHRCAVHEAAHAVAAVVTGAGQLVYATLHGRGTSGGHVRVEESEDDIPTLDVVERAAVRMLAAAAAEERIVGSVSIGSGGADYSDMGHVSALIAQIHASTFVAGARLHRADRSDALRTVRASPDLRIEVERHLGELYQRALDLVDRHRSRIVAVADELRRRRYLAADVIVEIVNSIPQDDGSNPVPPHRNFPRAI